MGGGRGTRPGVGLSERACVCVCVQDVQFDLEDLDQWEPILAGVSSKKQRKEKVLERKENRFLGKLSRKQEVWPDLNIDPNGIFHLVVVLLLCLG